MSHSTAAGRFRVALVNLCEAAYGYGPGASEYLRAALLSSPEVAENLDIRIFFLESVPSEEAASRILDFEPDFVGFTCYSWNLVLSGEVSRILRRRGSRVPIVWGGCSFAFFREDHSWFEWWDAVDAVAVGSGERTIVDIVRRLRAGERLDHAGPGLVVNRAGTLEFGPPAVTASSLEEVASPYLIGPQHRVPRPYIEMARGCKFQCAFCSDARVSREGQWKTGSVDRIRREIEAVVQWPEADWIDAGASTANVTDQHFAEVCEAIRLGDPTQRLQYSFQLYPAIVHESQRDAVRGLRIAKYILGLQSFSQEAWGPMRRKTTMDHLQRAHRILEGTGPIHTSFILGLPGETLDSFKRSADMVMAYEGIHVAFHRLLVLPGTQFHLNAAKYGLQFSAEKYYRVQATSTMPADDLRRAQEYVIEKASRQKDRMLNGRLRIDWTNFDEQVNAFDKPQYRHNEGRHDGPGIDNSAGF